MSESVFYFIFVFPLESVLGYLLDGLRALCGSYGLGIVLLSLLVNLFLLKLFLLADGMAKSHSAIKQGLDSKLREFKRVFRGMELYVYTKTLFKQKKYHPIFALKALGGLALQVPFFVAIVFLLEFHSPELVGLRFGIIEDLSKPDGLLFGVNLLPIVMSVFTLVNVWISSKERASRVQGVIITLVFLVLLYRMPSALLLYWSTSMLFAMLKSIVVYRLGQAKTAMNVESATLLAPQNPHLKSYKTISIYALLCICLMVFVFNPFGFYASDVTQFESAQMAPLLGALLGIFLLASFVFVYMVNFVCRIEMLRPWVAFGLLATLIVGLIYNFVLDYNVITGEHYSQIDNFAFQNPYNIFHYLNRYVDFTVVLLTGFFVFILLKYFKHLIPRIVLIIFISIGLVSFIRFVDIMNDSKRMVENLALDQKKNHGIPAYSDALLTLSKNKENILIVLSDAFSGAHLPIILEQYPEMKPHFDGFIYYANALAPSGHTDLTAHAILTGHSTTIWSNKNTDFDAFESLRRTRLKEILKYFATKYDVQTFNLPHLTEVQDRHELKENNVRSYVDYAGYLDYYLADHKEYFHIVNSFKGNNMPVGEMISMGLFNFAPYVFRHRIYRFNGEVYYSWIFGQGNALRDVFMTGVRNSSELASMVENFKVSTELSKPTFKYLHTMGTHAPHILDANCKLTLNAPSLVLEKYLYYVGKSGHYASEVCATKHFIALLDFLKKNEIYDNTMVLFISDHSLNDVPPSLDSLGVHPNPLILIKDFNSRGALRVDNRLMSNADVAGILCDVAMGGCEGVEGNILKNYPKNRSLIHAPIFDVSKATNRLIVKKAWEVRDSIFEPKNWREIPRDKL